MLHVAVVLLRRTGLWLNFKGFRGFRPVKHGAAVGENCLIADMAECVGLGRK